jgi:hypothetical protein
MRNTDRAARVMILLVAVVLISCILQVRAVAQSAGENTVYNSTTTTGSTAFIDASKLVSGTTICDTLYGILSAPGYIPSVIDARAITPSLTSMTCAAGKTPWQTSVSSTPISAPSTILLPPGTIVIHTSWILPANTRLIGEGDGLPSNGALSGTTIQSAPSFTVPGAMIQFGYSSCSALCPAISIENLVLDGQGQSVSGIVNQYSQDHSFVDHVGLYRILGTGLLVSGSAENSGPYSNIAFDTDGSATTSTVCAQILAVSGGTHGIHGLTCKSSSTAYPPAAVLLDSSGNSLEDIAVSGFSDGVLVGSNASALSNVLINIIGDTTRRPVATPVNAIHISSANPVEGLAIKGVSNSQLPGTYTIQDDLTALHLLDQYVAMYAAGKSSGGGYVRFTTSPNAPHWVTGKNSPSASPCVRGSLYSCIGGGSGSTCYNGASGPAYALWACVLNGSSVSWVPIM